MPLSSFGHQIHWSHEHVQTQLILWEGGEFIEKVQDRLAKT